MAANGPPKTVVELDNFNELTPSIWRDNSIRRGGFRVADGPHLYEFVVSDPHAAGGLSTRSDIADRVMVRHAKRIGEAQMRLCAMAQDRTRTPARRRSHCDRERRLTLQFLHHRDSHQLSGTDGALLDRKRPLARRSQPRVQRRSSANGLRPRQRMRPKPLKVLR